MHAGRKRRTPCSSVQYGCSQRAVALALRVEARAGRRFAFATERGGAAPGAGAPALLTSARSDAAGASLEPFAAAGVDADPSGQRSGKRRIPDASTDQAGMQLDGVSPAVARAAASRRTGASALPRPPIDRAPATETEEPVATFTAADRSASSAPQAAPVTSPDPIKANERNPMRPSHAIRQGCSSAKPHATRRSTRATLLLEPPRRRRQFSASPSTRPQQPSDERRSPSHPQPKPPTQHHTITRANLAAP